MIAFAIICRAHSLLLESYQVKYRKHIYASFLSMVDVVPGTVKVKQNSLYQFSLIMTYFTGAAHRLRCAACPIHSIALRTAPARMSRSDP